MRRNLLRQREPGREERVGAVELFFDLVFVFAVTQVSHTLIEHPDPLGFAQTAMLFLAVWWVWIYTAWFTNWLDVRHIPVRLVLFTLMAGSMLLAISMPRAFDDRALLFAGSYVTIQAGRSLFMIAALRGHSPVNHINFVRIFLWSLMEAPFWIAGALAEDPATRLWLWLAALAIITTGPFAGFWIPGLGRSDPKAWDVEAHHLAERCALFIIIALGESVLLTGTGFAAGAWNSARVLAFASAFIGTIAMWWLYFDIGAERGTARFAEVDDRGRMARLVYTYFHIPIVAGIIVVAASDEMVLAHPLGHAEGAAFAALIGGHALYLVGNLLFKGASARSRPLSHWAGLWILAALALFGRDLPPLSLSLLTTGTLIVVAVWEAISLRDTRRQLH